jgi:hypothetical protein
MNIVPSTSTRPTVNIIPDAPASPIPQMSVQVKSIGNSVESLSSFEQLLEQTFPKEILIEILRRLHPGRQVGHPWQRLLPFPYAQLLQYSAALTSEENTYALLDALSTIPSEWKYDAINTTCENFIRRINNSNTFIAIIDFIITRDTLHGQAIEAIIFGLTEVIGSFISCDIIPQFEMETLPDNIDSSEDRLNREEKNIQLETRLQKAQSQLFFHKVRKAHWDITYTNVEDLPPERSALINRMRQAFVDSAERYNYLLLKINQERAVFHATHRDSTMMEHDSTGSQRKTKNTYKAINNKIKNFNDNRYHHANLINRHVFEIFWNLIAGNRLKLKDNAIEEIQLKLAGTIGLLHKEQRHIALYAIIQSKKCRIPVLTALATTVNAQFYQHPYDVIQLIANEMETQHKNNQDVSPVISAIKTVIKNEPDSLWAEKVDSLTDYCQQLLRDAPSD